MKKLILNPQQQIDWEKFEKEVILSGGEGHQLYLECVKRMKVKYPELKFSV